MADTSTPMEATMISAKQEDQAILFQSLARNSAAWAAKSEGRAKREWQEMAARESLIARRLMGLGV